MIERLANIRLFKRSRLLKLFNLYPPFAGAGIRIRRISDDFRELDVELVLKAWNRNYVGTQFGGSLYAMTDPFYMLMLMENLGPGYTVWDKAAAIRFKKPGRGAVHAHFKLTQEKIDEIRSAADPKVDAEFRVDVVDGDGTLIAEVEKVVYVRRNSRTRE